MSHLLMIESWVAGSGRLLPPAITRLGHRYTFVVRSQRHYHDALTKEIHPTIAHADHVLTTDTNDVPGLIEFLQRQHEILRFDGVVTVCDYYIDAVAQVAQALKLPQAFSSNVVMERRKHLVREALQRAGLPNPRFQTMTSWEATRAAANAIGYPLVLKPTDLASSSFVRLVRDEVELRDAFAALEAFPRNFREQAREPCWLLEEFMSGDEVSVEACTFEGETTIVGITDKSLTGFPYFVEDGHMFPARLEPDVVDAVHDLVHRALVAVGHDHGTSHTEVKLTPDGPRIVEINPRPGGNYIAELIERVTGIDVMGAQVDLALGRRPDLTPKDTGVTSAAIKFLVPRKPGHVTALNGVETLDTDANVARWTINPVVGTEVAGPTNNACYLGHVIALDREGHDAREHATRAIDRIELTFGSAPS